MSYEVARLNGQRREVLFSDLPRLSSAYAHAIDWCERHRKSIIGQEHDKEHDGWDIMTDHLDHLVCERTR